MGFCLFAVPYLIIELTNEYENTGTIDMFPEGIGSIIAMIFGFIIYFVIKHILDSRYEVIRKGERKW